MYSVVHSGRKQEKEEKNKKMQKGRKKCSNKFQQASEESSVGWIFLFHSQALHSAKIFKCILKFAFESLDGLWEVHVISWRLTLKHHQADQALDSKNSWSNMIQLLVSASGHLVSDVCSGSRPGSFQLCTVLQRVHQLIMSYPATFGNRIIIMF